MPARSLETALARVTLGMLVVYIPGETWASLPDGLLNPYYIVDAIAMVLLLFGALHSLRARPRPAPGMLCGGTGGRPPMAGGPRSTDGRTLPTEARSITAKRNSPSSRAPRLWPSAASCFRSTWSSNPHRRDSRSEHLCSNSRNHLSAPGAPERLEQSSSVRTEFDMASLAERKPRKQERTASKTKRATAP